MEKLSSLQLLERLQQKGTRAPEYTRGVIKQQLNNDDADIATDELKVSVACPLGKMRMSYPCRPLSCSHLQCFDAMLFLQMNERKPTWQCPVCDSVALYDTLLVDGYFQEVIKSAELPEEENEILLKKNGDWEPLPKDEEEEKRREAQKKAEEGVDCVDLSDDEGGAAPSKPAAPPLPPDDDLGPVPPPPPPPAEIECIDLE